MADIKDVGQWIYQDRGRQTGNLRHVKLAYFAQAWSFAWVGRPLFEARIEAWPNGPVVRPLWAAETYDRDAAGTIIGADTSRMEPQEEEILRAVVGFYSPMRTERIKELSHDSAWEAAREGYSSAAHCEVELDPALILRHYSRLALVEPESTPKAPVGLVCGPRSVADVLDTSRLHRARWSVVHERLAPA
ncbi:MAG TPA: Panacea domain-containing protein [Cellulomonas sp.]